MPWVAAGAGWETSLHWEPQEENKHSIKAEFLFSNTFPCADGPLLWCLTRAIQRWYVLGMRISYSDYAEPILLLEIPLLVKILKNRDKILEVTLTPFPREDSWMWLSLGNTIYCSEQEEQKLKDFRS